MSDLHFEGCAHLSCNCLLVCNICNKTYPCKLCHDRIETHLVRAKDVTRMLCLQCGVIQTKSNECIKCNSRIARYFCSPCSIWSDKEEIFHCTYCSSCKFGEKAHYIHCVKCGVCIERKTSHNHIFGTVKNNCSICAETMSDPKKQVILMKCGHLIHEECYKATLESSVHCPICFKFIGDDGEIRKQISYILDQTKADHDNYTHEKGTVSCFECGKLNFNEKCGLFNECNGCGSFNTKIKEAEKEFHS